MNERGLVHTNNHSTKFLRETPVLEHIFRNTGKFRRTINEEKQTDKNPNQNELSRFRAVRVRMLRGFARKRERLVKKAA